MDIIGWVAWYDSRPRATRYNSNQTEWSDLPNDGVLAVVFLYDRMETTGQRARYVLMGYDWYGYDGDQLVAGNNDSLAENTQRYPTLTWKRGQWSTSRIMREVTDEVELTREP